MNFSKQLLVNYQKDANHSLAKVCRGVAILMIALGLLKAFGIFVLDSRYFIGVIALSVLVCLLPTLLFDVLKKNARWAQYLTLATITVMCSIMYAIVSYHSIMMLVFPLVCACLYNERKWIIFVMIISVPCIILGHLAAFYLHIVPDEPLVTMYGVIFYGILPRIIQLGAFGIIALSVIHKVQALITSLMDKNNELYESQQMLVTSLSELVEAQSQETGLHIKRVSEYTRILCEGLGLEPEETWKVSIASMMHDVGKLLVPPSIIEKPGKLTDAEFAEVKKHVDYGKQMLVKAPGELMQASAAIAYEHHEKWDGSGYKHLKGQEIDLYARCVAVADVFDALVSKRPYKKAWTAQEAYDEIVAQSGSHFDPAIIQVFMQCFDQFKQVMAKYPDGV